MSAETPGSCLTPAADEAPALKVPVAAGDEAQDDAQYQALRLENQLCFPLYTAARKITSAYTPLLKPLGLTYTQYIVFLALWERDEIAVGELGRQLHLDTGTLTPLLKKMEAAGWLTRTRSAADERVVILTLTEQGRSLRERAKTIPAQMSQHAALSPEEGALLYSLLYKIIDAD